MAAMTVEAAALLMPVLVDEIDDPLWCSYGRRPNNAYLIGMDGRVVLRQQWNDPAGMEASIQRYLEEGP